VTLVSVDDAILFFCLRDGPYFPTLRVLHQCTPVRLGTPRHSACTRVSDWGGDGPRRAAGGSDPHMMPQLQVDKGAIPFVLKGADIMCPGLTSAGGRLLPGLPKEAVVVRPPRRPRRPRHSVLLHR
jgi:malignant T-cell-amplified sequence